MHRSAWLLLLLTCLVGAEPIADYARKGNFHLFYGIYMLGNKVGWMSVREENVQFRGHEVHVAESTRHMERKAGIFSAKSVQSATVTYLSATPSLMVNAKTRQLATRILQGNPKNRAAHLQHWVYSRLQKTYSKNAVNSQQVLENMAGDCTEHAMLFVALARAAGIPAREVGGLMYVQGILGGSFAWQAWGEIHNGRRWVAMDPTWDEELIDATHIKMAESLDDYSWMQVLGKIQLTVIPIAPR